MPTSTSKLLVRLKTISKDFDNTDGSAVSVPGKDPIAIIPSNNNITNGWDEAHEAVASNPDYIFAEPEINSSETFYSYQQEIEERGESDASAYKDFIDYWPHPKKASLWHLGGEYSQLKKAKDEIAAMHPKKIVRIAHLDTGYASKHISNPASIIRKDLQRNFIDDEKDRWNNAEDSFIEGTLKMPGHGAGTLSILAGGKLAMPDYEFDDYIGLYDQVEIIPIRIAKSVVLLKSGAFVKALDYIVNELYPDPSKRVHVVTMSMGGLASRAWADMINIAYDKGIFIVCAAGNNFNKLPARTMIYPARFHRVVAACGVTYDLSPYAKPRGEGSFQIMEGNYGPDSLMDTAIAAFTPNVPWASHLQNNKVGVKGDGTSSATPQVASAAALYYIKYYDALEALPEGWMRVEAIRNALFSTAKKTITGWQGDYKKYFGNGILQAAAALSVPVPPQSSFRKQPEDKVSFPLIKLIFGLRAVDDESFQVDEMLETELMQLIISDPVLQLILDEEEKKVDELDKDDQLKIADAVLANPAASRALKEKMQLIKNQLPL
jgi:hypothetical protein